MRIDKRTDINLNIDIKGDMYTDVYKAWAQS